MKASQKRIKRELLSEESTVREPPRNMGWLAMIPTDMPPMRAKPVTMFLANSALASMKSPSSTSFLMTLRMS